MFSGETSETAPGVDKVKSSPFKAAGEMEELTQAERVERNNDHFAELVAEAERRAKDEVEAGVNKKDDPISEPFLGASRDNREGDRS